MGRRAWAEALWGHELRLGSVVGDRTQIGLRQLAGIPVVSRVMTTLWTCGCGRPCGLQWCSKDAMTQRCGLTGENVVIPAFCSGSSAA